MYTESIEMISLQVNNTNQIETLYFVVGTNDGIEVFRRREGRVWSPTDDIASDKLSGAHPDVKKLAATYWNPTVVATYAADLIATANAERGKIEAARIALEIETAAHDAAKVTAESAKAEADAAIAAAETAKKAVPKVDANGVPQEVTMRQARLALLGVGMLADITNAIDALPEPQKSAAQIEWEFSSNVMRNNGFVDQLAPALGLSSAQIDALFIAAAKL